VRACETRESGIEEKGDDAAAAAAGAGDGIEADGGKVVSSISVCPMLAAGKQEGFSRAAAAAAAVMGATIEDDDCDGAVGIAPVLVALVKVLARMLLNMLDP